MDIFFKFVFKKLKVCRKGTKLDFLDDMHKDIMDNFRDVMRREKVLHLDRICELTINRPAKRFYVSGLQAYKIVSQLRKGNNTCLNSMPDYRREMFFEILKRTNDYMLRHDFASKPLIFVVSHVVASQAPRFYISAETVRRLYYLRRKK